LLEERRLEEDLPRTGGADSLLLDRRWLEEDLLWAGDADALAEYSLLLERRWLEEDLLWAGDGFFLVFFFVFFLGIEETSASSSSELEDESCPRLLPRGSEATMIVDAKIKW
jgi:hypothetical protein